MKKLLLLSILFFLSTFSILAKSPCPTISVTAPNGLVKIGEPMTFTAKVDGISLENLKYKWTISAGTISSGQGTLTINVATIKEMGGQTVTATIEVSGLPQNCSNEFYGWGEIEPLIVSGGHPITVDYYEKISWDREKIKLDELAKELKKDEEVGAFFQISIKEKKYSQTFKIKKTRIEKYLIEKHKISRKRIMIFMSGNDETSTRIMFIPAGVAPPL